MLKRSTSFDSSKNLYVRDSCLLIMVWILWRSIYKLKNVLLIFRASGMVLQMMLLMIAVW